MSAIAWPATESATWTTTRFVATPSPQSAKSTTILGGRCRQKRSNVCVRWLEARSGGNLEIIDIIYRNLVLLRRKSSARSRRIVSDLVSAQQTTRNAGGRVETRCY